MNKRVVVTGVGLVTPLGVGKADFSRALFSGETGFGPITRFDPQRYPAKSAAQVKDFTPRDWIAPGTLRRMDLLSQMATASSCMALSDAGIQVDMDNHDAIGIILGTCFGGSDVTTQFGRVIFNDSPRHANPILVPNTVMNAPAGHAAAELGVRGVNATVNHREVSGEQAIAYGAETVARGRADVILAGGGDVLSEFCFEVLHRFNMMSPQDNGSEGARPFDLQRNGPVVGEGFGVLCLEARDRACDRGAAIYCEIGGWGMGSAPAAPVGWPSDPQGGIATITRAIIQAGIAPETVDAVCASANGGRQLDRLEVDTLRRVFLGPRCRPMITSIKGALGEGFASGGIKAAAMALAMRESRLPPVKGLEQPMADLNFVRTPLKGVVIKHALVNGIASGGTFSVLVLSRHDPS